MTSLYANIFSECEKVGSILIDPVKGRDGLWGISLVAGDHYFFIPHKDDWNEFVNGLLKTFTKICIWDVRRIIDWKLTDEHVIWDIKSLYGGEHTLLSLIQQALKLTPLKLFQEFIDLDQRIVAHSRALKTTKINIPVTQAIPPELLTSWLKARAAATAKLIQGPYPGEFAREYDGRWPFIRALHEVELNGIHVNLPFIEDRLNSMLEPATGKALRSMQGLCKGGFVTTLINPMGGKTGRIKHEGGFNSLGIPHGLARDAINSRFDNGMIYTFDFNAIDYRCIVNSIGGEVAKLYEGADDFHERTASFIFKDVTGIRRKNIKFLSYIYIYGGGEDTIVQKTGWSKENVKAVLDLLDKKIAPIKEFRQMLLMRAQNDGYIEVPGGRKVYIDDDLSSGKAIGLYAQTYSSWVFERAFVNAQKMLREMKSKVIFEVHDELVIDVHPDELEHMEDVRKVMEVNGHVVKMKKGPNYGQQA